MSGDFLLDTNIVIALFNGDADIIEWLKEASPLQYKDLRHTAAYRKFSL